MRPLESLCAVASYTATVSATVTSVSGSLSTADSSKVDLEPEGLEFDILSVNMNITSLGEGNSLGLAHYTSGANKNSANLETGYVINGKFYPVSESHVNGQGVYLSQQVNAVITINSTKLSAEASSSGLSTSEILGQLYEKKRGGINVCSNIFHANKCCRR